MLMIFIRFAALILIVASYGTPLSISEQNDPRPNIIVILADDLGYDDVGFTGETPIKTPVLDQLAQNGVIFQNGYVTHPYCGPSRAALLTGRYQARFGMENNVSYAPHDPNMGLPISEVTIANRLKAEGYTTGIVGKWHLGAAPHFQPNSRGFDYFYGFLDGGHNYMPHEVEMHAGGYLTPILRNRRPAEFTEYLTTALSLDAARFVRAYNDRPFFLYVSYNAPHSPLQAPEHLIEKYADIEDIDRRTYAAMVDAMDQGIGIIVEALKESGEFDNTLIFFLSDNGGVFPEYWMPDSDWADNSPFRRGKVSLLEGGIRVPFIAHWPNRIPGGQEFSGLVSALDIAATSVAIAGGDDFEQKLEGKNLLPYLTGERVGSPHEALFWRLEEADDIWAVRTPDSKYLNQDLPDVGLSFFDMREDPTERENLAGRDLETQAQMATLWNDWNAKNLNNILQQSWEYAAGQKAFYEQLHRENLQQAEDRQPYEIK